MSFKNFDLTRDIAVQPSVIHEVIGVSGSTFSGSSNVQYNNTIFSGTTSGGFFITIFDDNITSISSSALLDAAWGASVSSSLLVAASRMIDEKRRIYKQFAQLLLGNSSDLFNIGGSNRNELFFIGLKRRIFKNGVRKGNTSFKTHITSSRLASATFVDTNAPSSFTIGVAGEYADLSSSTVGIGGRLYYDAGVLVLIPGIVFSASSPADDVWSGSHGPTGSHYGQVIASGTFDNILEGFRLRWENFSFHNKTNLNSAQYFCRALNNEFNYSSNPKFTDSEGRIIVTSGSANTNKSRTYITKVGLYNANNECLAVASVSEPIRKDSQIEHVVRVRIDF